jgi:hypothetical protein
MITPLSIKTIYSKNYSLIHPEKIINLANSMGYTAIGLCDDNFYGVEDFFKEAVLKEIKPIFSLDLKELIVVAKNLNGFVNLSNLLVKNNLNFEALLKIQQDLAFIIPEEVSLDKNFNIEKYKQFKELYLEIRGKNEIEKLSEKLKIPLIANVKITYLFEKYPEFIDRYNKEYSKKLLLNKEFYSGTYLKDKYGDFPEEAIINNKKLVDNIEIFNVFNYLPKCKRDLKEIQEELREKLRKLNLSKNEIIFVSDKDSELLKKDISPLSFDDFIGHIIGYYVFLKNLKNELSSKIDFDFINERGNKEIFYLLTDNYKELKKLDKRDISFTPFDFKFINPFYRPLLLPRIKLLDDIDLEILNKKFNLKFYLKRTIINKEDILKIENWDWDFIDVFNKFAEFYNLEKIDIKKNLFAYERYNFFNTIRKGYSYIKLLKKLILNNYYCAKHKKDKVVNNFGNTLIKRQLISFLEDVGFIFGKDDFKEIIELSFTKE